MTRTLTVITGLLMLAMSGTPAQAGDNCSGKNLIKVENGEESIDGYKGYGIKSEDCYRENLDGDLNRASAMGAIVEFHPIGNLPESGGLWHANVTLANGDANVDAFAGGLNLMYISKQASGPLQTISIGATAGSSFDGQDQIYALTIGGTW